MDGVKHEQAIPDVLVVPQGPPNIDSNWDQQGWHYIGIGFGKQTTHSYESWTCCGHYKRDHEHMKINCCLYCLERENAETYKYCLPFGRGENFPAKWNHCLPFYCSMKDDRYNFKGFHLGVCGFGKNDEKYCGWLGPMGCSNNCDIWGLFPLCFVTDSKSDGTDCYTPICCCHSEPECCQPSQLHCVASICSPAGYCMCTEGYQTCYSWGCGYVKSPLEKMWCVPGFCYRKQFNVESQSEHIIIPARETWCYCIYCGMKQAGSTCCNLGICPQYVFETEVPVPDEVPNNPEWNEHVRKNNMLLQKATYTRDFFGKRYKLSTTSKPRQTDQWAEGQVAWVNQFDRQVPPERQQMNHGSHYQSGADLIGVMVGY